MAAAPFGTSPTARPGRGPEATGPAAAAGCASPLRVVCRLLVRRPLVWRQQIHLCLALPRNLRVEVHQLGDAPRHAVCRTRDHRSSVAVANEDHLAEVLKLQRAADLADMRLQIDLGAGQ